VTIGDAKAISIQQARDQAAVIIGKLASGVNPVEEKRERTRERARKAATLGELWAYYLENHARPHKRTWRVDEQRFTRHIDTWKNRKLCEVSKGDVERLHKQVGKKSGHYEANRLMALVHKMFSLADKVGYDGPNPVNGVEKFTEDSRERFLQPDEMPAFFDAVAKLHTTSPTAADAIAVALWTGARRGNVLSMRWDELALDRATWTIPGEKMKNGKPQTVHLPSPALEILRRRQEAAGASPWVFPGRRLGKHLSDPTRPWRELLKASGLKDLRPHDLRRTMGSWETATGANLQVVGKTLGHLDSTSTAVYARVNLAPVREAVDKAVAAMEVARDSKGQAVRLATVVTHPDNLKPSGVPVA
jgi:integrase